MTSRRKGSSSIHLRRPCRVRMPAASALDRGGDSTDALLLVRVPEATIRQLRDRSMPQRPDLQRGGHSSRPPSPSPQHDHCSHHDHHAQPKQRAPRRKACRQQAVGRRDRLPVMVCVLILRDAYRHRERRYGDPVLAAAALTPTPASLSCRGCLSEQFRRSMRDAPFESSE